jgi:small subunit ribosomal protein S3
MGQKVHPYGLRLGIIRQAKSTWFAEGRRYRDNVLGDLKVRRYIQEMGSGASIADVNIERSADTIIVTIETAKPGVVIGPRGRDVERLRLKLERLTGQKVRVNVEEAKDADMDAALVAQNIARQIERRVSYRRAMRQSMDRALKAGAKGIRCIVSGRLQGAEIARTESVGPLGRVPLHTLRADIDYGLAEARTGYGNIGVKVWVYRGDILPPRKVRVGDLYVPEDKEPTIAIVEPGAPTVVPIQSLETALVEEPAVAPAQVAGPVLTEPDIIGDPQDAVIVAEAFEEGASG